MQDTAYRSPPTLIKCSLQSRPASGQAGFQAAARFAANVEPSLDEMMSDPIFRRLLASDGLRVETVAELIEGARQNIASA